jgi:hypothetical protein
MRQAAASCGLSRSKQTSTNQNKKEKRGMKRLALISVLALGTAFGASAASATPATSNVAGLSTAHSGIQLVKDRRDHRNWRRHGWRNHGHRGWRRNDRYRGWHRYHHRPHNWRGRGCVIVGPIWFCP